MLGYLPITFDDVLYAAVLAAFVTIVIKNFIRLYRIFGNAKRLADSDHPLDVSNIMNKCYAMFPISEVNFHGSTFKRGMRVKVTTTANTDFEGEFIGGNDRNMLCIKTSKYIIAHEIKNISDIKSIG